jgi:tRNA dimethylallyltransferase
MPPRSPSVLLIAGPTASGKSALALRIAEAVDGEIVNADAIQVYRDLRVLSARPAADEEARAPHHLFGTVDAAEAWSAGRWQAAALAALAGIAARGRPAIVVGGTGLYLRALTHGLADIPAVPPVVRQAAAAAYDADGEAAFREALRRRDPAAEARIMGGDRQRLLRAFEVAEATGRSLSAWQAATHAPLAAGAWRAVVLEPPRAALYARCDRRLESMVQQGALDEAGRLMERRLDPQLPAMKALGLRELIACRRGELTLSDAVVLAQQQTRQFAKRQSTWFRNQTPAWARITALDADGQWGQWKDAQEVP